MEMKHSRTQNVQGSVARISIETEKAEPAREVVEAPKAPEATVAKRGGTMIEVYSEDEALTPEEEAGIRTACEAALAVEGAAGDITVLVAGPDHIRQLNRDFRQVDRVTDVLTFPSREGEDLPGSPDGYLGDIMICRSRAVEQAAEYGHSLSRELAFLAVHGTLHILGYDHMNEAEEQVMRARQRTILERIGETR